MPCYYRNYFCSQKNKNKIESVMKTIITLILIGNMLYIFIVWWIVEKRGECYPKLLTCYVKNSNQIFTTAHYTHIEIHHTSYSIVIRSVFHKNINNRSVDNNDLIEIHLIIWISSLKYFSSEFFCKVFDDSIFYANNKKLQDKLTNDRSTMGGD